MAGERAWQIKNNKDLRDIDGALIFPMMTIQRTGMSKDPAKKGVFYGNIDPRTIDPVNGKWKGGSIEIARRIQQSKTADFLNSDSARRWGPNGENKPSNGQINFPNNKKNRKIVYESISIPMPVYVDISYTLHIRTEYQQQMNQIIQPFFVKTGAINSTMIEKEKHKYEMFIQPEFSENNNVTDLGDETRIYETQIPIKVLGYLVGADKNQETPKIVITENAVDVKIPRERTIFRDEIPWKHGKQPE